MTRREADKAKKEKAKLAAKEKKKKEKKEKEEKKEREKKEKKKKEKKKDEEGDKEKKKEERSRSTTSTIVRPRLQPYDWSPAPSSPPISRKETLYVTGTARKIAGKGGTAKDVQSAAKGIHEVKSLFTIPTDATPEPRRAASQAPQPRPTPTPSPASSPTSLKKMRRRSCTTRASPASRPCAPASATMMPTACWTASASSARAGRRRRTAASPRSSRHVSATSSSGLRSGASAPMESSKQPPTSSV